MFWALEILILRGKSGFFLPPASFYFTCLLIMIRYVQGERIGAGASGSVWWGLDTTSGKVIAVKGFYHLPGRDLENEVSEITELFGIGRARSITSVSWSIVSYPYAANFLVGIYPPDPWLCWR